MKTILIATDFSDASRNASLYGVELAKELNANIILFNAYKIPQSAAGLNVTISRYDVMMQVDKRLLDEADFLDPKKRLIEVICDEGVAEDVIINIANEKKADFIITGMKGSSKNFKRIFGSTATALAKNTNIPLIIIPEDALYKTPEIIVFANESIETNKHLPEQLSAITKFFKSKLYVVNVVTDKNEEWLENPEIQKPRRVVEVPDASWQYPVDTDIRHALSEFTKKHNADMLVMMPHKHDWLERIFIKSETKDMIFHTHIPLLILPDEQHENQLVREKEMGRQI